jgi:Tfp pilus assembly PilM family ATPase
MELFAAACRLSLVDEREEILRKAGFRLRIVMPAPMAYTRLLRHYYQAYPALANSSTVFVESFQSVKV